MSEHFRIRRTWYDDPDPVALTVAAQAFYTELYGGPDETPFTAADFAPPHGSFLVGYLQDDRPAAMGGWRFSPIQAPPHARRPAEIKRMFVVGEHRRLGLARRMLTALEADAQAAGADWMILETGQPQVAAVALYRATGYRDIPPYGYYGAQPGVVSLGKPLTEVPGTRR